MTPARISALALGAALLAAPTRAPARDDIRQLPVAEALASPAAKAKVDSRVKLYFGRTPHPAGRVLGQWTSNKKTNAFGKSERDACEWAFLSAVLQLQKRARDEGGDAVVEIESVYRDTLTVSDTDFTCGVGAVVAGVALRGKIVKLR